MNDNKQMLKEVEKRWKQNIEEQRLKLLTEGVPEEIIDFFENMVFIEAEVVTEEFDVEYDTHGHEVTLTGYRLTVKFPPIKEILGYEEDIARICNYETFDGGTGHSRTGWHISEMDDDWDSFDSVSGIEGFQEFFDVGKNSEEVEKLINDFLYSFQMMYAIDEIHTKIESERKKKEHEELIRKYDGKNVNLVVEYGELFIQFHDGKKIKFNS